MLFSTMRRSNFSSMWVFLGLKSPCCSECMSEKIRVSYAVQAAEPSYSVNDGRMKKKTENLGKWIKIHFSLKNFSFYIFWWNFPIECYFLKGNEFELHLLLVQSCHNSVGFSVCVNPAKRQNIDDRTSQKYLILGLPQSDISRNCSQRNKTNLLLLRRAYNFLWRYSLWRVASCWLVDEMGPSDWLQRNIGPRWVTCVRQW